MNVLQIIAGHISSDIRMATPILFAGLGLLLINHSGLLCIGAEGIMLMASLTAVIGSFYTGSVAIGFACALLAGIVMGLLFAFLTVTVKANQIVTGVAINVLGSGLSATISRLLFDVGKPTKIPVFQNISIPVLSRIPFFGKAFFSHMLPVYLAFVLVPMLTFYLFRTQRGLNLRAVGEDPKVSDTMGINIFRTQYLATIAGGLLIAAGGAFLSTGLVSSFSEEMVSGRGFIALAAVIFGRYKPAGVLLASVVFVTGNVLSNVLQVAGTPIPYTLLTMTPYLLTIIALTIFAKGAVAPASLGRIYRRG